MEQRLPVVYHPDTNITLAGLERLHPFDSRKYGRVVEGLIGMGVLRSLQNLFGKLELRSA